MTIAPGENVGPYRVIEQLGSGGMATVFKAYHASLDRYVAIKILHPAFKADPQFFERFKREARIVANLEHPNIIPVYDFNEHHGEPYLIMRFVDGDTLKPEMQGQPMPAHQILRLMRPVCQALHYAHTQGVLHRDIKPSNLMVTSDGSIFITDFGLARMVQAGESTLSQDMMIGTPQYISPEQAQGMSNLDSRTDIYSLGVVLYEMVTGQVPFNADTPFATVHDHIYTPLPPPSKLNPNIDPGVERLLLKALAKEPEDRFETAADLLQVLEATLGPIAATSFAHPVAAPVSTDQPKKSGIAPWMIWAGSGVVALFLCLLLILAGYRLLGNRFRDIPENVPISAPIVNNDQPVDGGQVLPPLSDEQNDNSPSPLLPDAQSNSPPPTAPPPPPEEQVDAPPDTDSNSPEHQEPIDLIEDANQAMRAGNFDEAAELFDQAIAADPSNVSAYFGLSEALKQTGDEAGSLDALAAAIKNNPDHAGAYMRMGEALLDDNPEESLALFEKAAELKPNAALPYAGQAIALLNLDRNEAAKKAINTALHLDPDNPEAHLANAVYQAKQGHKRAALQELQQVAHNRKASEQVKDRAIQLLQELRN